jgi:N-methylhydantoinase A
MAGGHARGELEREFRKLETAARQEFRAERWVGTPLFERSLDLRYRGQGYELNIPATANATIRFHEEHQRRYGYHHPGKNVELVTVRLRGRIKARKAQGTQRAARRTSRQAMPADRARVVFQGKGVATPVYERSYLIPGQSLKGPAVIAEYSATTIIPPGKRFHVDRAENLVIAIK